MTDLIETIRRTLVPIHKEGYPFILIGIVLLWISAILTIYTGWDYLRAGIHHLTEEDR